MPSVGATTNWYAAASGGAPLVTGVGGPNNSTYTTTISGPTPVWASASIGGGSATVGAANTAISGSLSGQTTTTSGINFDVLAPVV